VKPFLILIAFPGLLGILAEIAFRNARKASLAAVIGTVAMTLASVQVLEPGAAWNWVAALLVSPLPIAISVAFAMFWHGRRGSPRNAH
jgi:cytochrome bd-type quinol oxidase subunit 2